MTDRRQKLAPHGKRGMSRAALAVLVGVFVVAVVVFLFANPGGPGAESGVGRGESPPEPGVARTP